MPQIYVRYLHAKTFVYAVYHLFFHPLAHFPGPFWAKFTCLYSGYHAWKGDLHIDMQRCHEKYGMSSVRLAGCVPNCCRGLCSLCAEPTFDQHIYWASWYVAFVSNRP